MKETTKKIAGVTSSLVLLSSMGMGAIAYADDITPAPEADGSETAATEAGSIQVSVPSVEGAFSYTQESVSTLDEIARAVGDAKYLCGAAAANTTATSAEDWTIAITGAVSESYATTVADIQNDPAVQKVLLGCSCAGNPADGNASVAARVTGVSVKLLLDRAGIEAGANTVVFRSADGYQVALPLSYVTQRYCPIVFDVNDSPIAESVGGTNQLWLGSTSAKYFARDIVSITVEKRAEAPAAPGTTEAGDTYANLPNIGVAFGGEVA